MMNAGGNKIRSLWLRRIVTAMPTRWRYIFGGLVTMLLVGLTYLIYYLFTSTPLPVYTLDRLNLRPFFLPNIKCKHCNNFTVNYLVHEKAKCNLGEDIFLLNFLISYSPNVRARNIVRETWGSVKEYRGLKVKTLFVFGVHSDKNFNKQLVFEQKKFGDIVQGEFTDDYSHLTEKTMMMLEWIVKFCPQVQYVLKTDDDSFNHPHRIIDFLLDVRVPNFVGGYCFTVKPDRRKDSKYHVPQETYPDMYYPTYCAGPGYILSKGAIRALVTVAPDVTYLGMEDVYVAGMCREQAKIPYTQIPGMVISQDAMSECDLATWAKNAHNVVPEIQVKLWARALRADPVVDCYSRNVIMWMKVILCLALWFLFVLYMKRRPQAS